MKCDVITLDNSAAGSIELADDVFGLEVRVDLLQRVVRWQLAKRQAGTHKTKGISEISGTTKKPFKQRAPVVLVRVPCVPPSSVAVRPFSGRWCVRTPTICRRRSVRWV